MEIHEEFNAKCGEIAVNIEGDYTIIVDKDLNKFKYHSQDNKIIIIVDSGKIKIIIYKL